MTNNTGSSEASEAIAKLDTLRRKHGADSEIGFACSNYIEQIKSYQKETDVAARAHLAVGMANSQERLDRLIPRDPQ